MKEWNDRKPRAERERLAFTKNNPIVPATDPDPVHANPFTAPSSPNFAINASATTLVHLAGAAGMGTNSDAGCQGATFNIPVSITVHKP